MGTNKLQNFKQANSLIENQLELFLELDYLTIQHNVEVNENSSFLNSVFGSFKGEGSRGYEGKGEESGGKLLSLPLI